MSHDFSCHVKSILFASSPESTLLLCSIKDRNSSGVELPPIAIDTICDVSHNSIGHSSPRLQRRLSDKCNGDSAINSIARGDGVDQEAATLTAVRSAMVTRVFPYHSSKALETLRLPSAFCRFARSEVAFW